MSFQDMCLSNKVFTNVLGSGLSHSSSPLNVVLSFSQCPIVLSFSVIMLEDKNIF